MESEQLSPPALSSSSRMRCSSSESLYEDAVGQDDEEGEEEDSNKVESAVDDIKNAEPTVASSSSQSVVQLPPPANAWRTSLLQQAAARDQHADGISLLYAQYRECLGGLQNAMRGGGSRSAYSGVFLPRSREGSPQLRPTDATDPSAPSPASAALAAAEATNKRLQQTLRLKEQELEALRHVIREREEELNEKDKAHAMLSRHATQLTRTIDELEAQLQQAKAQLQTTGKAQGTSGDPSLLSSSARAVGGTRGEEGGSLESSPASAVVQPQQCVLRKIHGSELTCIAAAIVNSPPLPSRLVAIGTADGFVKLLDGSNARPHAQISVSRELPRVVLVDLSPGSGLLLASSSDHAVRLLDLRAQKMVHVLRGHLEPLGGCGFLNGDRQAFTAAADATIKLWDLEKGQSLRTLTCTSAITAATAHGPSGLVAVGYRDGSLSFWDSRTDAPMQARGVVHGGDGHGAVLGVRISPDGTSVLSQTQDGSVTLLALQTMKVLATLDDLGPVEGPSPPAFAGDGSCFLVRGSTGVRCGKASTAELTLSHETPEPAGVCWELPQAITAHRNGHVGLWGAATTS